MNNGKKVVIIGPAYPYRGGQALVEGNLFSTLTSLGYDCTTISFTLLYPKIFFPGTTQFDESGTTFFKHNDKIIRMINSVNPITWIKAALKIRKINPTAVIFIWWMPFFGPAYWTIGKLLKLFRKTNIVYLIENYISHENRWFDKLSSKMTLNLANYFICQSKFTTKQIAVNHPGTTIFEKTLTGFDSYNLNRYTKEEAREKLGITTNNVVLFFGLIRPYKGLDKLISAFKILKQEMSDVTLLIVGEAYEDIDKYKKQITDEGVEESVLMINKFIPNEDVEIYFKAADLNCLPYNSATQSGILMMSYGFRVPAVATNVGGLAELIKENETGVVVEDNEPQKLVDGLLKAFAMLKTTDIEKNIADLSSSIGYKNMTSMFEQITALK